MIYCANVLPLGQAYMDQVPALSLQNMAPIENTETLKRQSTPEIIFRMMYQTPSTIIPKQ